MGNILLKNILDDEFLGVLAKSADLYKIGSNSILDPEEIRIGLKVVPRAVMSMLISELTPMEINSHKDIHLPFGKSAVIRLNKNAADDYTGSVYDNNKLVYDFKNRSIPGLGIIILSTFELYDLEDLSKPPIKENEDIDRKVQKLIDERMELHFLVGKVVEEKLAQREAIHKIMMRKLSEAIPQKANSIPAIGPIDVKPSDVAKALTRDKYGPANTTGHEKGVHTGVEFREREKPFAGQSDAGAHLRDSQNPSLPHSIQSEQRAYGLSAHRKVLSDLKNMPKPNLPKSEDLSKKEKGSPLKSFLDRKKKPKEYHVEMAKSETTECDSCGQTIFGSSGYSGCICMGQDQHRKIWIKKTEDGVQLRFSRGWSEDNMELLLETLRKNNGKN